MPEKSITACKCCGQDFTRADIRLYAAEIVEAGFEINSAFRCPAHNEEVGGVPGSTHLQGLALDLKRPIYDRNTSKWLTMIMDMNPTFVKLYPWGLHVDWR